MISGNEILTYLEKALIATATQLLLLFGTFILLGLLLYLISRSLRIIFVKTLGYKSQVYVTGWLGVPVHEMGHIVFCLLFGHKIKKIYLFKPEKSSGTLGQVIHQYNSANLYHRLGNFFIGIGPLISGSLMLFLFLHFLPNYSQIKEQLFSFNSQPQLTTFDPMITWLKMAGMHAYELIRMMISPSNLNNAFSWIFLFFSIAVVSHMHLSPSDLKVSWSGMKIIIVLVLFINLILIALGIDITSYVTQSNHIAGFINTLMIFANILAIGAFLGFYLLFNLLFLIIRKEWLNPFSTRQ